MAQTVQMLKIFSSASLIPNQLTSWISPLQGLITFSFGMFFFYFTNLLILFKGPSQKFRILSFLAFSVMMLTCFLYQDLQWGYVFWLIILMFLAILKEVPQSWNRLFAFSLTIPYFLKALWQAYDLLRHSSASKQWNIPEYVRSIFINNTASHSSNYIDYFNSPKAETALKLAFLLIIFLQVIPLIFHLYKKDRYAIGCILALNVFTLLTFNSWLFQHVVLSLIIISDMHLTVADQQ